MLVRAHIAISTCLLWTMGSYAVEQVLVSHEREEISHCSKCEGGKWAEWTGWGPCTDSECHLSFGTKTRQTDCYILKQGPQSRSDGGSNGKARQSKWERVCRKIEKQQCVQELTCDGKWGKWGSWTECERSDKNEGGKCVRSRRRLCKDIRNNRLPGSHCYGGAANDTKIHHCKEDECPQNESTEQFESILSYPLLNDATIRPASVESPEKRKDHKVSQSTILIVAVAVGSLIFGALFVFMLLNVARRSNDDSSASHSDRWKRVGSLNTSSTVCSGGYATASDIMSPRLDLREVQSPSGSTTTSGNSSLQTQFFGRSEVRSPDMGAGAPLITVSGSVTATDEIPRPRRSRLLQENVYWEITDRPGTVSSASEETDERSSSPDESRQLVNNVLYGSRA